MAEALIEPCKDISHVVKGNPSKYVKLNVGGSLHYTTIGKMVLFNGKGLKPYHHVLVKYLSLAELFSVVMNFLMFS